MSEAPGEEGWPVLESTAEYETGWYTGGYDLVEQPDGTTKRYYWADLPNAVVVVARAPWPTMTAAVAGDSTVPTTPGEGADVASPSGRAESREAILFVRQYRPTIRETHLELPAGIVEDGESYTAAAARELEEETGLAPSSTTLLQEYAVATGVLRHRRGIVFAEGLEPGQPDRDSNEFLEVVPVPVEAAIETARADPAHDASLTGLLLARADGLL